jgi:hypothetical protein
MKTGTTSIQALLNANAARLPSVRVVAYGDATQALRLAGRRLARDGGSAARSALATAFGQVLEEARASGARHTIVSDENIVGRVLYDRRGNLFGWSRHVLQILDASAGTDLDIRILFYTRSPEAWLRSVYNQMVKRARETRTFEAWCEEMPFTVEWKRWHEAFQESTRFPVEFRAMEDDLHDPGLLGARVLELLDVPRQEWTTLDMPQTQNPSLPETALRLMRRINRLPLPDRTVLRISEAVEARRSWFAAR